MDAAKWIGARIAWRINVADEPDVAFEGRIDTASDLGDGVVRVSGALAGGAVAGCTFDDEPEGCAGRDRRHEGDPTDCVTEWARCHTCGVHER